MRDGRQAWQGWSKLWMIAAFVAACGAGDGTIATPGTPLTRLESGDSLPAIARVAAYSGALPCAKCSAIETTLLLHPDGSYRMRELHVGDDAPNVFVSVGRWSYRADSVPRVTLFTAGTPRQFALPDALTLIALDSSGKAIESNEPQTLTRVVAPSTLDGVVRVRGEFRYFADASTLVECTGGTLFPVAGDSAMVRLQRAHRENVLGAGASVILQMMGRLQPLPGGKSGSRPETLVVDSFTVEPPRSTCEATRVRATAAIGDWQLRSLDGTALPELTRELQPTLRFVLNEPMMAGNAGCNRFTGRPVLRGLDLSPSALAITRRICADSLANQRETRYARVLESGGWFRLEGTTLILSSGGVERARFSPR